MANPRYQPKELLTAKTRRDFGRSDDIEWQTRVTKKSNRRLATKSEFGASLLQHELAMWMREAMHFKRISIRDYSKLTGESTDRIGKLLRGDIVMRLTDVADARTYLGLKVELQPSPSDLKPDKEAGSRLPEAPLSDGE